MRLSFSGDTVIESSPKYFTCYLDDSLLALYLAGKVDSYGDLILYAFEIEEIKGFIYVFRRYVVQNGTVFQCAYY